MDDVGLQSRKGPRQLPTRFQIELMIGGQRQQLQPLGRPTPQLAVGVRHEHRAMPGSPQAKDGQQDLILTAPPRSRGIDMKTEHGDLKAEG